MNEQNEDYSKLDLSVGSLEFWVRENKLDWSDGKATILFNIAKSNGSLFVIKDSDNKLKCYHVILGKGRTDIEIDILKLDKFDKNKAHQTVITWDINTDKKLSLYIDGKLAGAKNIEY